MAPQSRPPNSRPPVLLTRPLAQSQRFAGELAGRFGAVDCLIAPLMAPHFLPPAAPLPERLGAVVFTSETGVTGALRAGITPDSTGARLAYCVGARTAQAAQAQGFAARDAGGDWRDLLALITAQPPPPGDLLFCAAREAPDDLPRALAALGLVLHRCDVYEQRAQPLSAAARAALAQARPLIVPLFSPRSTALFCAAAQGAHAPLWVAALSPQVAQALTLPAARSALAHRPNSAAMLDALAPWL